MKSDYDKQGWTIKVILFLTKDAFSEPLKQSKVGCVNNKAPVQWH